MPIPLTDLLLAPPLTSRQYGQLPGAGEPTLSNKSWTSGYEEVTQQHLNLLVDPTLEQINVLFGDAGPLETFLGSTRVHPENDIHQWFQSEGDSVRAFHTRVSNQVMLGFQPRILVERSEAGPLGTTQYPQTVDFTWSYSDECAVLGELKRHGIISIPHWSGQENPNSTRRRLGKELRGYCHRYKAAAAIVFDGKHALILIFLARRERDICEADCPVQGFIISVTSPLLRYVLFRTACQQLQKCQAQLAPPVTLDGYTRHFMWYTGEPYWSGENGGIWQVHPNGYTRCFDQTNGAWYWADVDGNTVVDGNGQVVRDTPGLF